LNRVTLEFERVTLRQHSTVDATVGQMAERDDLVGAARKAEPQVAASRLVRAGYQPRPIT
jgi:hypothetical protein